MLRKRNTLICACITDNTSINLKLFKKILNVLNAAKMIKIDFGQNVSLVYLTDRNRFHGNILFSINYCVKFNWKIIFSMSTVVIFHGHSCRLSLLLWQLFSANMVVTVTDTNARLKN